MGSGAAVAAGVASAPVVGAKVASVWPSADVGRTDMSSLSDRNWLTNAWASSTVAGLYGL